MDALYRQYETCRPLQAICTRCWVKVRQYRALVSKAQDDKAPGVIHADRHQAKPLGEDVHC